MSLNLVLNPGFEPPWSGWIGLSQSWAPRALALDPTTTFELIHPYQGSFFAGTAGNDFTSLSQNLPTAPGQAYTLSFAFHPGADATFGPFGEGINGETQVFWGGHLILDLAGDLGLGADGGWQVYILPGLQAQSTSTQLLFSSRQDASLNGLDAVSVTAVPEPATGLMLIFGFIILTLLVASPANARYHHRHFPSRHGHQYSHRGYHCPTGMIWLRHDRECVWKYVQRVQPTKVQPATVAKKSDRLPSEAPISELPYWEPFPIMGKPSGRWWHL